MFVLTIIPLHLSFDSDGVEANKSNDIDVAEHNVMAIEALLTSIDLNQYLPGDTFVMNTTDPNIISQNLEQTRQKELDSINSTWIASNNDSQARLDTILRTKNAVEQRLQDLQALSKALEGGTRLNYIVSGVDNTNINSVSNELNRVTNYQQRLNNTENFWNRIIQEKSKIQELQEASKSWDTQFADLMHTTTLDSAYDFWKNIMVSKDSVQNLANATSSWNDTVGNLYQASEKETNDNISQTQEIATGFQSIADSFNVILSSPDQSQGIEEITNQINNLETLINQVSDPQVKGKITDAINLWKAFSQSQQQNAEIQNESDATNQLLDQQQNTDIQNLQVEFNAAVQLLNQKQQTMEQQREQTIASTLWNKLSDSQKQDTSSDFWNQIFNSADNAKASESAAILWNSTSQIGTDSTKELQASSNAWQEFIQQIKQGQDSQDASILGKQIIDSLKLSGNLQIASNTWINNTIEHMGQKMQDTKVDISNNLSNKFDPGMLAKMAMSERRIANLRSLFSGLSQKTNAPEIISKLESVKNKLATEQKKLTGANSNGSAEKIVGDLRSELKSLLTQKSVSELLTSVEDSVKSSIQEEINGLFSTFDVNQILYFG